jgi:hypothetical protein
MRKTGNGFPVPGVKESLSRLLIIHTSGDDDVFWVILGSVVNANRRQSVIARDRIETSPHHCRNVNCDWALMQRRRDAALNNCRIATIAPGTATATDSQPKGWSNIKACPSVVKRAIG